MKTWRISLGGLLVVLGMVLIDYVGTNAILASTLFLIVPGSILAYQGVVEK